MSDRILYGILGFFVGTVVGGYFVGHVCTKEAKKRINYFELENINLKKKIKEANDNDAMEFEDFEDPFDESDEDANDIPSLIHKYGGKPEEIKMVHKDPDSIRMIDAETFNRDINIVDNETLTYYQEDGVLVDAANNVIKNEEEVIGSKLMDEIFDCPESDEYFYVINDDEEKMYEVVVEHNQSFYRDIMGDMND